VHAEHGIAKFIGRAGAQIDLVQKYVGGFSGKPPLSHVGGTKWKNAEGEGRRERARPRGGDAPRARRARAHAGHPLPRATPRGSASSRPSSLQETEDQLAAISEIKKDMSGARPMDRLLCGDVGFGKTEVAIRAAFKACEYGKQVAVLVPTTVLAEQHERTFRERFAGYPFRSRA
jgi:transcription-repair coupling factor (superfamily II helicase)